MMTKMSPITSATNMDFSPVPKQPVYEDISNEELPEIPRPPPLPLNPEIDEDRREFMDKLHARGDGESTEVN